MVSFTQEQGCQSKPGRSIPVDEDHREQGSAPDLPPIHHPQTFLDPTLLFKLITTSFLLALQRIRESRQIFSCTSSHICVLYLFQQICIYSIKYSGNGIYFNKIWRACAFFFFTFIINSFSATTKCAHFLATNYCIEICFEIFQISCIKVNVPCVFVCVVQ